MNRIKEFKELDGISAFTSEINASVNDVRSNMETESNFSTSEVSTMNPQNEYYKKL